MEGRRQSKAGHRRAAQHGTAAGCSIYAYIYTHIVPLPLVSRPDEHVSLPRQDEQKAAVARVHVHHAKATGREVGGDNDVRA
jgi:hypothetical protein